MSSVSGFYLLYVLLQVRETCIHNSLAGIKLTVNKRLLQAAVCCCCSPAGCLHYSLGCSRSLQAGGPPASADACPGLSRGKLVILFPSLMYNASVCRFGLLSLNEARFYWMRRLRLSAAGSFCGILLARYPQSLDSPRLTTEYWSHVYFRVWQSLDWLWNKRSHKSLGATRREGNSSSVRTAINNGDEDSVFVFRHNSGSR